MNYRPRAPEGTTIGHLRGQLDHLRLVQLSMGTSSTHLLTLCIAALAVGIGARKVFHVSVILCLLLSISIVILLCVYACAGDPRKRSEAHGFGSEVAQLFRAGSSDDAAADDKDEASSISDLSSEETKVRDIHICATL